MTQESCQEGFMVSYLNKLPTKPSSTLRATKLTDAHENDTTQYLLACLFSQRKQSINPIPSGTSASVFQAVMVAAVATFSVTMVAMFWDHEA